MIEVYAICRLDILRVIKNMSTLFIKLLIRNFGILLLHFPHTLSCHLTVQQAEKETNRKTSAGKYTVCVCVYARGCLDTTSLVHAEVIPNYRANFAP